MQQKIGLASILTMIAMLFALATLGGTPASEASTNAVEPAHAVAVQHAGDMP
jgi:hypothetical protein